MPEPSVIRKAHESNSSLKVSLASPRGFCAGVERAIETVKECLHRFGSPVYVLHEIVHNRHVIEELKKGGAVFVEKLEDIPEGEVCIFSAHGVSLATKMHARELGLRTVDATCPLVTSVHRMVEKYHANGGDVIIIGHHNHPEVEGTAGRVTSGVHIVATVEEAQSIRIINRDNLAYVTQTTLSKGDIDPIVEVLKARFPRINGPRSNICFATQNRQNAVRELAEVSEVVWVVGSKNSSNSNRLREVALECGATAQLIDDYRDIDPEWLVGVQNIGITAGASAPEDLVLGVLEWLAARGKIEVVELDGIEEKVHFKTAQPEEGMS